MAMHKHLLSKNRCQLEHSMFYWLGWSIQTSNSFHILRQKGCLCNQFSHNHPDFHWFLSIFADICFASTQWMRIGSRRATITVKIVDIIIGILLIFRHFGLPILYDCSRFDFVPHNFSLYLAVFGLLLWIWCLIWLKIVFKRSVFTLKTFKRFQTSYGSFRTTLWPTLTHPPINRLLASS